MNYGRFIKRFFTAGITGFLLAQSIALYGQPFEPLNASLLPAGRSALSWCDFDNDDDLDLLISGISTGESRITALYRNDAGFFTMLPAQFPGLKEASTAWGDYDRDGDMDLLIAGNAETGDMTRIFRNDEGAFTEIDAGIVPVQQGEVCWLDLDHDEDLDIFVTGNWFAKIYLNENGAFNPADVNFGPFSASSASWGDMDNDGDLDLLINGDSGAGAVSKVFRNDGGAFSDTEAGLFGLMAGTADWIDYDNDGDLDVALSGFDDALEARFYMYKNIGKTFEIIYTGIDGFAIGSASWGDYDLDGDPDLLMSGKATGCGAYVSGIYRNDGDDVFYKTSYTFITATRCALSWADFENDGDLDFALAGLNTSDMPFTRIYLNQAGDNLFESNTPPLAPIGLSSAVTDDQAALAWSDGADEQTAAAALSYNLVLGDAPGSCRIIAPMSDLQSGGRNVTGQGNAAQNHTWTIAGLEPGTYYWSVQAIDQAQKGSVFAPWQSFEIIATATGDNETDDVLILTWPNPASDHMWISLPPGTSAARALITEVSGRSCMQVEIGPGTSSLSLWNLQSGTYVLEVSYGEVLYRDKLIIRR